MMNSSQQIKLGAVFSYISLVVNILAGLIYTPWMINSIGRDNFGLYTLAMSVITLFLFDFGLSSAVIRFLSKYIAENKQDKANACLGMLYRMYIYIDVMLLFILTAFYFFIPEIYKELTLDEIERFKVVYAMAAIFSVISFPFIPVNGVLSANEKFVQLKLCEVIHKLLIISMMSICLLMGFGLYALVFVNAGAGILTILMKLWCIKRYTNAHANLKNNDYQQTREIIGFSAWTTIISLCSRMIFPLAPTILGIFAGSIPIAIFGIASTLEGYVYCFSSAISGMFLPRVSRIVAQSGGDVLPLMIRVGRIQLMISGAVVVGFICFGQHFINLWVGEGFSQSYFCALLLILPSLYHLPHDIGQQAIYVKNEVKAQAIVWIVMAVVNVVLSFLLVCLYGVVGICASICIAYFIRTIGLDIIFKVRLHLNLAKFFKETFLFIGIMIIIVTYISITVINRLPGNDIWSFIVKFVFFLAIYIIGLCIVSTKEEKKLVLKAVKSMVYRMKFRGKIAKS